MLADGLAGIAAHVGGSFGVVPRIGRGRRKVPTMASAHDLMRTLAKGDRLAFFAHINPKLWEVVGGGPLGRSRVNIAALNPQPLPPVARMLDPQPDPPGAVGYSQLVTMAIAAIGAGESGARSFHSDIDDWCGTGWPRRWPPPKPKVEREESVDYLLGAAFGAARLAAAYDGGEMADLFGSAAEQLLDAALAQG